MQHSETTQIRTEIILKQAFGDFSSLFFFLLPSY